MVINRSLDNFSNDLEYVTKDAKNITNYFMTKDSINYIYDNGVKVSQVSEGFVLEIPKGVIK
ncbi:hypothetical protein FC831_13970 [Clostridium botulinum]|nr:hypothetical protein [Clostridium botulinum]